MWSSWLVLGVVNCVSLHVKECFPPSLRKRSVSVCAQRWPSVALRVAGLHVYQPADQPSFMANV